SGRGGRGPRVKPMLAAWANLRTKSHRRHDASSVGGSSWNQPSGRSRPDAWAVSLGGVLIGALVLRLWGVKHGLPYVYNVDEASNFVPTAVSFFFTDSFNPHYFINPPGFSYLLYAVLGIWFGGGDDVG